MSVLCSKGGHDIAHYSCSQTGSLAACLYYAARVATKSCLAAGATAVELILLATCCCALMQVPHQREVRLRQLLPSRHSVQRAEAHKGVTGRRCRSIEIVEAAAHTLVALQELESVADPKLCIMCSWRSIRL